MSQPNAAQLSLHASGCDPLPLSPSHRKRHNALGRAARREIRCKRQKRCILPDHLRDELWGFLPVCRPFASPKDATLSLNPPRHVNPWLTVASFEVVLLPTLWERKACLVPGADIDAMIERNMTSIRL